MDKIEIKIVYDPETETIEFDVEDESVLPHEVVGVLSLAATMYMKMGAIDENPNDEKPNRWDWRNKGK